MPHIATRRLAAILCLVAAATAGAQRSGSSSSSSNGGSRGGSSGGGMNLSDRVDAMYDAKYVETPDAGRSDWMSYVVLWRGQAAWRSPRRIDPVAQKEGERSYREASAAATLAGHSFMGSYAGSYAYWAELDNKDNAIYVLGQQYHIPERDSTLVILVDRADGVGGAPFIVGTAVIDGRMSSAAAPKTWVSGDTIFTVRSKHTGVDDFFAALKKDPAIAAFLQ